MNSKKFAGLIIMMLLSIVGIIWVQIVWIKNAIGIQNDGFNNRVSMSLLNAANSIESSRKMNFSIISCLPTLFRIMIHHLIYYGYLSIGGYSSAPG
jgi:hypothetical protein